MYDSQTKLTARVRDLERRLAAIEPFILGEAEQPFDLSELLQLYAEASIGPEKATPQLHLLWVSQIKRLHTTQLVQMGERLADPFPWKPFLHVLDFFAAEGFDVEDVTLQLKVRAQELLDLQGMGKLRVEDIVARPARLSEAFLSYQNMRIGGKTE